MKKVIVFAAVTAAVLFCTGCVNPLWPDYVKGSGDGSGRSSGSVVSGPDLREMVRIKGGYVPFYDGSGYKTKVPDFLIGKYEITQDFFESVIANGGDSITGGSRRENLPAGHVNWYDAVVFCNRLSVMEGLIPVYTVEGSTDPDDWGTVPRVPDDVAPSKYVLPEKWKNISMDLSADGYRLPTVAEWRYAALGNEDDSLTEFAGFDGSNESLIDEYAWYDGKGGYEPHPVGQKKANGYGLYDMTGNVLEWCWDWTGSETHDRTTASLYTGPASGTEKVAIGGGYWSGLQFCDFGRSEAIYPETPAIGWCAMKIGFRVARSVPGDE